MYGPAHSYNLCSGADRTMPMVVYLHNGRADCRKALLQCQVDHAIVEVKSSFGQLATC